MHATVADELVLEFDGECGFARGGEAGQPDCEAALGAEGVALGAGEAAGVVGDVAVGRVWLVGGVLGIRDWGLGMGDVRGHFEGVVWYG